MRIFLAIALVAAPLATAGLAAAETSPQGIWALENGKVIVRISSCGQGLCGTIVGLKKPLDKHGKPKVDKKNPNPALRTRPVVGLTILSNMRPDGDNKWAGKIYNADDGRTYASYMRLDGSTMKIKGCVAFICKKMTFVRQD